MRRSLLLATWLFGCAGGDPVGLTTATDAAPGDTDPGPVADCYPDGATEPMALGEVLSPYAWPAAFSRATGDKLDIDLAQVPCASDPDIDWSAHDVLVFVSIPAW